MFEVSLQFGSWINLLLFLAVAGGGTVALAWLWPRLVAAGRLRAVAAGLALGHLGLLCAWAAQVRVDSDEVEHLHVSWLVAQGLTPYRDFWQNHSPLFWYLLAPAVAAFQSASVLVFARILAAALFLAVAAASGWWCWRVYRSRAAAIAAALIVLAPGVRLEGAWLRPDQLAALLAVAALAVVAAGRPSPLQALLAGAALGLSVCLTPKTSLLTAVFPVAVLLFARFSRGEQARLIAWYALGGVAGAVPLFAVLLRHGIFNDWVLWTFTLHGNHLQLHKFFPGALAALAAVAAVSMFRERLPSDDGDDRRLPRLLLALAFVAQSIGTLLIPYHVAADLLPWAAIAAVLAGPLLVRWITEAADLLAPPEKRRAMALLAAAAVLLIEVESVSYLLVRTSVGDFASDRARIDWAIEQAAGEPVVLLTPVHSIFSHDATGLYHLWQYNHYLTDPLVNASLHDFGLNVIEKRPAVIAANPRRLTDDPQRDPAARPALLDVLAGSGVITESEWHVLRRFLEDNYTLQRVENDLFYVRKR